MTFSYSNPARALSFPTMVELFQRIRGKYMDVRCGIADLFRALVTHRQGGHQRIVNYQLL